MGVSAIAGRTNEGLPVAANARKQAGGGLAHRVLEGPMNQVWTGIPSSWDSESAPGHRLGVGRLTAVFRQVDAVMRRSKFFQWLFYSGFSFGSTSRPNLRMKKKPHPWPKGLFVSEHSNQRNHALFDQRLHVHMSLRDAE